MDTVFESVRRKKKSIAKNNIYIANEYFKKKEGVNLRQNKTYFLTFSFFITSNINLEKNASNLVGS